MNYSDFDIQVPDPKTDICIEAFRENQDKIQVKKEKLVIKNLRKIFDATLEIGIRKGFQAMTMRDLSRVSGLSMGGLYSYFSSKEELLTVYLGQGRKIIKNVLESFIGKEDNPVEKLRSGIQTHLYLSEKMHEWFYFSYMEARNLGPEERERSIQSELFSEQLFADILEKGASEGAFCDMDYVMCASMIKAMLQDWYLKRGKYARRKVHVDQYADFIMDFISPFCMSREPDKK